MTAGGLSAVEFVDLAAAQIAARGDVQAFDPPVEVLTAWPSADRSTSDRIILAVDISATVEPGAVGRNRQDESVTVVCQIRVFRPGAGVTVESSARDRVVELYRTVDNEMRTNHPELAGPDDDVMFARCGSYELQQWPTPGGDPDVAGRWAVAEFDLIYRARVAVA